MDTDSGSGSTAAMLTSLFRLDGTPKVHQQGEAMPSMSPGDEVTNILFRGEQWYQSRKKIKKVTFRNVSIQNMDLFQLTFTECTFEDCLFNGSRFREVEFHKCRFVDTSMWKAKFEQCYLDPRTIRLDRRYRVEAANVPVTMYQALLSNYSNERQDAFYADADIQFRRWKRYQLDWDIRSGKVDRMPGEWAKLKSLTYDVLAGYGYKPVRLFGFTILFFLAISLLNHFLIGADLVVNGARPATSSIVDSIFYSFSVLTVLGFSTVVPDSPFAKMLTVFEALAAIGWLSIFTSVLVKRFLR